MAKRIQPKNNIRKIIRSRFTSNLRQAYIGSVFLLVVLAVYYVWTLNANANNGYRARRIELERAEIEKEKNLLKIDVAKKESLEILFSQSDSLVPISDSEVLYFIVDTK